MTEFLRSRVNSALAVLEDHLAGREFVTGGQPTIADLSICGYLYFADEFDVDWTDHPAISAWLERIKALPGWVHPYELMPRASATGVTAVVAPQAAFQTPIGRIRARVLIVLGGQTW